MLFSFCSPSNDDVLLINSKIIIILRINLNNNNTNNSHNNNINNIP